jgi:exopolysaccharide biosynthesis polyprenyl glycosylphosphotransferase
MPALGMELRVSVRMSQRPQSAAPPSGTEGGSLPPQPERTEVATRLGLTGAEASRRRGPLLRRMLATGDWAAVVGALCLATALTSTTDIAALFWATLFSPVWLLVIKLHGLYDNDHRRIRHSTFDELPALVSASALGVLTLDGLMALSPVGSLSPDSAILVGVAGLAGCFAARAVLRFAWHHLAGNAIGIVIGPASSVDLVARRVSTHPEARLTLAGYLSPPDEAAATELPRLGSLADISTVAPAYSVERVVVTSEEMSESAAEKLIEQCKLAGLGLTFLPQHFGLLGPGIELNRLAELPVLDFRFSDPPRSTIAMKRGLDVLVSGLMLALLSPLMLAISVLILVDSGAPVLFRQKRAGKNGAPFMMRKFRTMVTDAEARLSELVDLEKLDEPAFKIPDDPRITRAGRFLRRTSLDELPQLINVLRGEMSLVGPRPEEEAVVALYNERQRIRLAVKPGLTGPMQVYGRGDLTFEERLAIERDYLDNLSIAGDLAILLRTPRAIVRGEGAY